MDGTDELEQELAKIRDFGKRPSFNEVINSRKKLSDDLSLERRIVDYISMMTDNYALRSYQKYSMPKKWF